MLLPASSTWSRPAARCRCRCRSRRSPQSESRSRTARAGRSSPAPARPRTAGRCRSGTEPKLAALELRKQDGKGKAKPPARPGWEAGAAVAGGKDRVSRSKSRNWTARAGESANAGKGAADRQMPSLPAPERRSSRPESRNWTAGAGQVRDAGKGAADRQMPSLPAQKTKILATEVRKQDGKGRAKSASSGAIAGAGSSVLRAENSATGLPDSAPKEDPRDQSRSRTAKAEPTPSAPARFFRRAGPVACVETENPRDRSQEAGRQRRGGVP